MKVITLLLIVLLSACSIKAEFGFHGRTGRDDRTKTIEFRKVRAERY